MYRRSFGICRRSVSNSHAQFMHSFCYTFTNLKMTHEKVTMQYSKSLMEYTNYIL